MSKFIMQTFGVGLISVICVGCASIVSGTTQNVAVAPLKNGSIDTSTTCTVSNQKGSWITSGGGSVTVKKARDDLMVRCVDPTTNGVGMQSAPRSTQIGWAVANFFIWDFCTISCLFDFGSGAIYEYPSQVQVLMPTNHSVTQPQAIPAPTKSEATPSSAKGITF